MSYRDGEDAPGCDGPPTSRRELRRARFNEWVSTTKSPVGLTLAMTIAAIGGLGRCVRTGIKWALWLLGAPLVLLYCVGLGAIGREDAYPSVREHILLLFGFWIVVLLPLTTWALAGEEAAAGAAVFAVLVTFITSLMVRER